MCNSSNKVDFTTLAPVVGDSSYLAPDSINMHVSMPCPLKVPFRQIFTPFVEKYNALHPNMPIYCPNISDCASIDIDMMLETAKSEDDLPDIIVTTNYKVLFSNGFYDRFVRNHIYEGVTKKTCFEAMPQSLKSSFIKNNIGVLCFSSWSIVQDLTVSDVPTNIASWADIISAERVGQITAHGHLDRATFGLAYFIEQNFGKEALAQYAKNIVDIKHFSQVIKRLGSSDKHKTAFNILPDVAVSKIPSSKKVKILDLKEGKVLSPMILMVKSSKLAMCREILEQLWSENIRTMLVDGGCIMPCRIDKNKPFSVPDFSIMASDYDRIEKELDDIYISNLPMHKIEERMVAGGVCK